MTNLERTRGATRDLAGLAAEVIWSARLMVPVGKLAAGELMRVYLAMFITWRDGKIVSQRNYDCFEPF